MSLRFCLQTSREPQVYQLGLFLFVWLGLAASANSLELYVADNGSDSNPGTRTRPFATLERARDELRSRRKQARTKETNTVWIARGDYLRTNALILTEQDSGTEQSPVIWRSLPAQRVRLLGGRKLNGFKPVTDPAVLPRLAENARSHVLQIDLRALGISDFGEMKSRGFGRPRTPSHCELFFNSKPMTLARWPNEGAWEQITGFPEANAQNDEHGGKIGKLEDGFFFAGDQPRRWQDTTDLWVHGYWSWDWANSYERVASIDLDQRLVKTSAPFGLYGFRKGQRFYFLNILEELDQPGEWFLDRRSGLLYFWPPEPIIPATEVIFSLLAEPLLRFESVSHVTIQGLVLEAARGDAVDIRGGNNNAIAGCLIRNIGDNAVTISGGAAHRVLSCDIFDTGDGGVSLEGGDRQTLTPGGQMVANCHFARQGRWSKCYVPAVLMNGVGLRASHNLIHNHPHCAILFSGNDHLIDFNEIHHIALETGDVGAIYAGRDYTYRGNRIRFNFIHETGGVGMGSMGVYMDDCVSGTEIFGNIFYRVQRAAFLGGGRDHQVINNVFVECNHAVELDGRGLDASPVWHEMVNKTMRESLKAVPAGLYRERYPAMKDLDAFYGPPGGPPIEGFVFKGVPPQNNVVSRNVCVGKWLNVYWHATADMLQLQNNFTNAADCFVKPPAGDSTAGFALKADAPVWNGGFERIPAEKIGLYQDGLRSELR